MTIAKYESFLDLFRMASSQLSHVPLASTHRPSIAFFLILTTIFAVPFLALSPFLELLPQALPLVAYSLWDSLFGIFTSSPFYFFLLNFLIAALVLSSGVLHTSLSRQAFDDPQEEDVHRRGHHYYVPTAVQIFHERLALDELYGAQASSVPYLSFTDSSHVYVADDGVFQNRYGDEGEDAMGKHTVTDPVASFTLQGSVFSGREGIDDALPRHAFETGSSSTIRMDAIGDSPVADSAPEDDTQVKKISPLWSSDVNGEIATVHDACLYAFKDTHAKGTQVYDHDQHSKAEVHVENSNDITDGCANVIIDDDTKGSDDVNHDAAGNVRTVDGHHVTDIDVNDCHIADVDAMLRIPSQPMTAGTIKSQKHENVGSNMGSFCEDVRAGSICLHEESVKLVDEEEQRSKRRSLRDDGKSSSSEARGRGEIESQKGMVGGEEQRAERLLSMSAEELNERASAFITAFRRKLISTAIDDQALGHTGEPGQI